MSRPRVFISSSYYDLRDFRSALETFTSALGFEPVMSEKGSIAYAPDIPLDESCYLEASSSDIFVLILGGRYGSAADSATGDRPEDFFERYDSITKGEYRAAREGGIPIFVLIERPVYSEYRTFLKNRNNESVRYAYVDSVNIFLLIEEILSQARNKAFFEFDRYSDVEPWLREQWAGLFKTLLSRLSEQQQLSAFGGQLHQLSEMNKTLKAYLEAVMKNVSTSESVELIDSESKRLEQVSVEADLKEIDLFSYLEQRHAVPISEIYEVMKDSKSIDGFTKKLIESMGSELLEFDIKRLISVDQDRFAEEINAGRELMGLSKLRWYRRAGLFDTLRP